MVRDSIRVNIVVTNKEPNFFKAFYHAWKGIQQFFLHDRNGRIHLGAAIAAVMAGFVFHISNFEWAVLLVCIAGVISLEMINAAIEKLCDMVHATYHPTIKIIKDVSAGAVLFVSMISVVIAAIIFIPKIMELL